MFTGIIQEIGRVRQIDRGRDFFTLHVQLDHLINEVVRGDSLATNGVCLTVVEKRGDTVLLDIMPETFRLTNLQSLTPGDAVNLEPAMRLGDRFGGHIVSGHVDGVGTIAGKKHDGNAVVLRIKANAEVLKYVILKGSITLDGVSLTVVEVNNTDFSVSIIPVTGEDTILLTKGVGEKINLECDVIGKYVERMVFYKDDEVSTEKQSAIDMSLLRNNGFL